MQRILPFIAAAAAGALLAAQPAMAAPQVAIDYRDLDLSTPQGQKELDHRLTRAARQVCRTTAVQTGSNVRSWVDPDCVKEVVARSRAQVLAQLDKHNAGGSPARTPAGANPVP
jgi:UrcA family protein